MASQYHKYERISVYFQINVCKETNHYQARTCESFDSKDNVKKIKVEGLASQCLVGLSVSK